MNPLSSESVLSPFAKTIVEVPEKYTPLAKSVLKTQCQRAGLNPSGVGAKDLGEIIPLIVIAVTRFTSPDKGEKSKMELLGRETFATDPVKPLHLPGGLGLVGQQTGILLYEKQSCIRRI